MAERKAVIKNADMSEDMQQDAVDCASQVRLCVGDGREGVEGGRRAFYFGTWARVGCVLRGGVWMAGRVGW